MIRNKNKKLLISSVWAFFVCLCVPNIYSCDTDKRGKTGCEWPQSTGKMACGLRVPKNSDVLRRNAGTKHNEPKRTSREAARCVSVHSVSHPYSAGSHLTSGDSLSVRTQRKHTACLVRTRQAGEVYGHHSFGKASGKFLSFTYFQLLIVKNNT